MMGALVLLASPLRGHVFGEPPGQIEARAQALAEEAKQAFKEARFEDAASLFTEAYELIQHQDLSGKPELLYNASLAHLRAGACERAAASFEQVLVLDPEASKSRKLASQLREARECAPLVALETEPPGARVTVDGVPRGETPLSLRLATGRHAIDFALDGHEALRKELSVERGNETTLRAKLDPLAVAVGTPLTRAPPDASPGPSQEALRPRSEIEDTAPANEVAPAAPLSFAQGPHPNTRETTHWFWTASSVGGAALIATIVFALASSSADRSQERYLRENTQCESDPIAACHPRQAILDAQSDARAFAIGANVSGALAVTGIAAAALLLFAGEDAASAPARDDPVVDVEISTHRRFDLSE